MLSLNFCLLNIELVSRNVFVFVSGLSDLQLVWALLRQLSKLLFIHLLVILLFLLVMELLSSKQNTILTWRFNNLVLFYALICQILLMSYFSIILRSSLNYKVYSDIIKIRLSVFKWICSSLCENVVVNVEALNFVVVNYLDWVKWVSVVVRNQPEAYLLVVLKLKSEVFASFSTKFDKRVFRRTFSTSRTG